MTDVVVRGKTNRQNIRLVICAELLVGDRVFGKSYQNVVREWCVVERLIKHSARRPHATGDEMWEIVCVVRGFVEVLPRHIIFTSALQIFTFIRQQSIPMRREKLIGHVSFVESR